MLISQLLTFASIAAIAAADSPSSSKISLPRTATINGFADPIYDRLPQCAQGCVNQPVGRCPYWEPGCLCVLQPFPDSVAACWAENCVGNDVSVAVSLANSVCSSIGVPSPYWKIGESYSTILDSLANVVASSSLPIITSDASSSDVTAEPTSNIIPDTSSYASVVPSADTTVEPSAKVSSSETTTATSVEVSSSEATAVPSSDVSSETTIVTSADASIEPSADASIEPSADASIEPSSEITVASSSSDEVSLITSEGDISTSECVIDDITVIVTEETTKIITICTKCKTLTGPVTTYTTLEKGITITVTEECETTDKLYTTYTTVKGGVTKIITEECNTTTYTTMEEVVKEGVTTTVTKTITSEVPHTKESEKELTMYLKVDTTVVSSTLRGNTETAVSVKVSESAASATVVSVQEANNAVQDSPVTYLMGLAVLVAGMFL